MVLVLASVFGYATELTVFNEQVVLASALLAATVVSIVAVSAKVLGNGLDSVGISTLLKTGFFGGLWGLLTGLSIDNMVSIPYVGYIIYFVLFIMYIIGVISQIGGGGGGT